MNTNGEKFVYVDGLRFCRDDRTGYYLNRKKQIRLHRYIWERENGQIPPGYDIHHKDFDKNNNAIENLRLVSSEEHHEIHNKALTDDQRKSSRERFLKNVIPSAIRWHKSNAGRAWHRKHSSEASKISNRLVLKKCLYCGEVKLINIRRKFCCNACKSAWRRKAGLDDITIVCDCCGTEFKRSKYFIHKDKPNFCSHRCASKALIAQGIMPMGCHGRRKVSPAIHQESLAL